GSPARSRASARRLCSTVWHSPLGQDCSGCGHRKTDLTLADRTYTCVQCGLVIDRDRNAARNILARGNALVAVGRHCLGSREKPRLEAWGVVTRVGCAGVPSFLLAGIGCAKAARRAIAKWRGRPPPRSTSRHVPETSLYRSVAQGGACIVR